MVDQGDYEEGQGSHFFSNAMAWMDLLQVGGSQVGFRFLIGPNTYGSVDIEA